MKIPNIYLETIKKGDVIFDLGCGEEIQPNAIGIDARDFDTNIVGDLEVTPYEGLPDGCAKLLIASHIVEHIKPWLFIPVMNEWWRLLKPEGQLMIATPYAGNSLYWQDPTHCNGCNQFTWSYFDPFHQAGLGYKVYRPMPWKIEKNVWDVSGNLEVLMTKRPDDPAYHDWRKGKI